ncbi:MAG: methionyl-tRNA formyltransferase [Planctomycetales bacterium]
MRLVMMGTGPFAVPALQRLWDSAHEVQGLVARPPVAARGRRRTPPVSPTKELALRLGMPVWEPADVNAADFREHLESLRADLLIVVDYGQILSRETLAAATHGGLNIHASLLPKYRGAAPINWAIYHGETESGVTVIQMTPTLDGGPCVVQESVPIGPDETAEELESRLSEVGADAVMQAIQAVGSDAVRPLDQDPSLATKAPRLKKSDGEIDWSRSAEAIRRQLRAMQPWPKSFTFWRPPSRDPLRLIIDQAEVRSLASAESPGTILAADGRQLIVATGEGALEIVQVQPAGKRVMPVADFLNGQLVEPGQVFGPTKTA